MGLKLHASYFAIGDTFKPWVWLDGWLNPYSCSTSIELRKQKLDVIWTRRAEQALQTRSSPLFVEMQLYFSCVVKKRVLFHDAPIADADPADIVKINERIQIFFRAVEASSCDPDEFARNYPVQQEFKTLPALKMHPSKLKLDFKGGRWIGEFSV